MIGWKKKERMDGKEMRVWEETRECNRMGRDWKGMRGWEEMGRKGE